MYELPVVVPDTFSHMDTDVKMYSLPPIQGNADAIPKNDTGSVDGLAVLEGRQEAILDRLQNLKIRVDSLQGVNKKQSLEHLEIAVHASPSHPPHSLPL